MLSVKNLVKIYKTKGGAEVRALDGISADFPETGMVFLLGKSGSGKSTLLNVAGGLDVPDSGEIIVKGRSSKDFSAVDFDSYRNTYIGFIFQEYNILNEFNVEQNISLALQLQGKPNDKHAVNDILEQVDLQGLNKRKPSTLSGGQKQRVAIARALIKEPQIIMADEPTGALDSKTGEQVLSTLKKLSAKKLVLVVSHDADFAEKFGDRIIELKDGKIISDTTKENAPSQRLSDNVNFIGDDTVNVKDLSALSEGELKAVAEKMRAAGGEGVIVFGRKNVETVKSACKITENGEKERFIATDTEKICENIPECDGKDVKFIKSTLPFPRALKLGLSGLKVKPVRLIFTILLSVIAFTMFGVVATIMAFDAGYSVGVALEGSPYDNIELKKEYSFDFVHYYLNPDGTTSVKDSFYRRNSARFGVEEIADLNRRGENEKLNFAGVFNYGYYASESLNNSTKNGEYTFASSLPHSTVPTDYYARGIYGFTDCGEKFLSDNGFETVAGEYPRNANEIMLPEFIYESIKFHGFRNVSVSENGNWLYENPDAVTISSPEELIGKYLLLQKQSSNGRSRPFKITGIVNTGSLENFAEVKDGSEGESLSGMLKYTELLSTYKDYIENSFHTVLFVAPSFYDEQRRYFGSDSTETLYYIDNVRASNAREFAFNALHNSVENPYEAVVKGVSVYCYVKEIVRSNPEAFTIFKTDGRNANRISSETFSLNDDEAYISLQSQYFAGIAQLIEDYGAFIGATEEVKAAVEHVTNYSEPDKYDYGSDAYIKNPYRVPFTDDEITTLWNFMYDLLYVKELPAEIQTVRTFYQNSFDKIMCRNVNGVIKNFKIAGFYVIDNLYGANRGAFIYPTAAVTELHAAEDGSLPTIMDIKTDYEYSPDQRYDSLITKTDNQVSRTQFMLSAAGESAYYIMNNKIYADAQIIISLLTEMQKEFLIAGCIFGAFAALMLFNFISVSISYKKKEVGILRAVGARGADVFKIFFAESGFIALISFFLSSIAAFFVCGTLNNTTLASETISLKLLNYGLPQVGAILLISILISVLATIIPVYFAAKKPPVESIRAL